MLNVIGGVLGKTSLIYRRLLKGNPLQVTKKLHEKNKLKINPTFPSQNSGL